MNKKKLMIFELLFLVIMRCTVVNLNIFCEILYIILITLYINKRVKKEE